MGFYFFFIASFVMFPLSEGQVVNQCAEQEEFKDHSTCTLFPESTLGPYFVEGIVTRQNVTEGKRGVPLELSIIVVDVTTCKPLPKVTVDIWSCDADGQYSSFIGVTLPPNMGPEGDGKYIPKQHDKKTFLRGVQNTDDNGKVKFYTLIPGWYPRRAAHIHVIAHVNRGRHTGQLYFEQNLQDEIAKNEHYQGNTEKRTSNAEDRIFNSAGGQTTTLKLKTSTCGGYTASILMGVNGGGEGNGGGEENGGDKGNGGGNGNGGGEGDGDGEGSGGGKENGGGEAQLGVSASASTIHIFVVSIISCQLISLA